MFPEQATDVGDNKWENLFWHQPQSADGELKDIENNVTKDLLFLIQSNDCPKTQKQFRKLIKEKTKQEDVRNILRIDCQISDKSLEELPKKKAWLFFLSKKNPDECTDEKNKKRILIDGLIEFENHIIFLEVKTDSPKSNEQLDRYVRALTRAFGGQYQEKIDVDWDEIYTKLNDARKETKDKSIEKFLVTQFLDCLRVMKLTSDFYGFNGTVRSVHNHELRCLLDELKLKTEYKIDYDKTKKQTASWIPFTLDGERKKCHFTIWRNNENLELMITLMDEKEIEKLVKCENVGKISDEIRKICDWNLISGGQKNTVELCKQLLVNIVSCLKA